MEREQKELPDDVTIPEQSIASAEMYRHMYAIISKETEFNKLKELSQSTVELNELWEETEYQKLIDAGLAVRNSGAGDPYIRITSLGEAFATHGPENGLRELIEGEYEAEERYSSDE